MWDDLGEDECDVEDSNIEIFPPDQDELTDIANIDENGLHAEDDGEL